jgi:hypothetical protein
MNPHCSTSSDNHPPRMFSRTILFRSVRGRWLKSEVFSLDPFIEILP